MTDAIRIGLIGCSSIAARRFVPALVSSTARLTAVAARDPARAAAFAARFGAAATTGYRELLARDDVDAVYVSVPTGRHAAETTAALAAGRHVLVEKPLAVDAAEGAAVLAAARRAGRVVMENRMFVHHGQHRVAAELLADGAIGDLRVLGAAMAVPPLPADDIRHRSDLGGGALLDVGYYPAHAALLHLSTPLEVLGATRRTDPRYDVEVGGAALLRDAAGVDAHLTYGFTHAYRSRYELWGERGRLVLERAFTPAAGWHPVLRLHRQDRVELRTLPAEDHFRGALDAFLAAVRGDAEPAAHGARTLAGLALLDAIRAVGRRVGPRR
ncbi:Gfo/Idh/MocA family oxidoreductase [Micromonospora sp. WMMD1076]|uniref:Gfo/Idh/MocA family protein n=1 Tax=Micromonospora sp. WMMD1076 TaxID=3016103 RepID=UPI00249B55AE|nr:Gfo/Idh/MocA family oxidoreductase [Micromonospora sp. WMMD1076]WFF04552.1 Gfo/Idh/MocA family oxidoreductase [Micromonospora sp. WMMD1076]